jgi:flagellum-specific ATP synthase
MEELIRLGAYRPGSSAEVDEAIGLHPALEAFLGQNKAESTSLAEGYERLAAILSAPAAAPAAGIRGKP